MHLLIIEDDPGLAGTLQAVLKAEGHAVDLATSGQDAIVRVSRRSHDAVLLDLLLRDIRGLELLGRLRQQGVSSPIIALGGKAGTAQVIRALDAGADEYITRPVSPDELAARIRALFRRGAPTGSVVLDFQNVTLNVITHQGEVNGRRLRLTPKEFSLLHQFMRRHGEAISRTELLEKVWEMHFDPGSNVVDVHISRLRSKLHQAGATVVIEAVRGAGFVLVPKPVMAPPGEHDVVA
jgi:two-component system, OmpR family, response regulator